ncbi:CPBP family intramembrane glutamic endopeptidase [Xanthomonas tesorieronis]|uniref:CPBP family intramembrane glutamic endopeptidase n=1 Tax=Xanthomonas tesorieronis TaxID=3160839 RepID=UPI0035152C4D
MVATALGLPIYWSLSAVLAPAFEPSFSEAGLWGLAFYELLVLALLVPVLWFRSWTPQALGLRWQGRDIRPAIGLLLACIAACYPLKWLGADMAEGVNPSMDAMVAGKLSLAAVVVVSLINPIFEEVFVCAYVIRVLQRRHSPAFAVNVSVAIRASYHLYQGPIGAISLVIVGLILGWWFARTGRLWPAIIAHGLMDLLALVAYA